MKNKIFLVLLCLAISCSTVACGSSSDKKIDISKLSEEEREKLMEKLQEQDEEDEQDKEDEKEDDGKDTIINTKTENIQTEIQENIVQEMAWIQAYKNFLNNRENFISILKDENEYGGNTQILGFVLHDVNQDGTPELLINRNRMFTVYAYSYSSETGEVKYHGKVQNGEHTTVDCYEYSTWGINKETDKMYIYTEGDGTLTGSDEVGLKIGLSRVSLGENFNKSEQWYGEVALSEIKKVDSSFIQGESNVAPFCGLMKGNEYTENILSDEEAADIVKNFIPLEWKKVEKAEIENYICLDYKKQNLSVKVDYEKPFPSDNSVQQHYNEEELVKTLNPKNMITFQTEATFGITGTYYHGEYYYVDLERLCVISAIDGKDEHKIVKVNAPDGYVNFRTGPGTNYPIITPINNGTEFEVCKIDSSEKWWGVYYNNQFGWISKSQVSVLSDVVYEEETGKRIVIEPIVFTKAELEQIKEIFGCFSEDEEITIYVGETVYLQDEKKLVAYVNMYSENTDANGMFDKDLNCYSSGIY